MGLRRTDVGGWPVLDDSLALKPVDRLARHAWSHHERLDLFADIGRSADAIGTFAGLSEANAYLDYCKRSRRIYETLRDPFMRASRPSPVGLMNRVGLRGLGDLLRISPFTTFARALRSIFAIPVCASYSAVTRPIAVLLRSMRRRR